MRNDCILEVAKWIEVFPDRFLDNDYVVVLIKSISDNVYIFLTAAFMFLSFVVYSMLWFA